MRLLGILLSLRAIFILNIMKKILSKAVYIAAACLFIGCAKTEKVGPNDANQRYFEAWMQVNHPDATPSGLGIYMLEDKQGSGVKIGEEGFMLIDYKITDLEGNISTYSDALTAKQLGEYSKTKYYGPHFWTTVETTLPAGLRDAVIGQPVGTYRKFIVPSWLMSYQAYDTEEDYLDPPLKRKEEYDASSYSNTIYEITLVDYTEDVEQWQIDSIGRFFHNRTVTIDGKPAADVFLTDTGRQMTAADSVSRGFYYKQIQAPTDTTSFTGDTTIYINYVGKLLNGQVFDTNIARVAKDNNLYSTSSTYEPMLVNWTKEVSEITMGTDGSTVITGFAETIARMKAMEKGVGVFYSTLGYGYSGSGDNIPAYAPLIFEIELVAKPEE